MEKDYFTKSVLDIFQKLNTQKNGLTTQEAEKRLQQNGENKLKTAKKKNLFLVFLSQFTDVMIIILLIASTISMVIAFYNHSTSEFIDGIIILGIVFLNAIIGFLQEKKASDAIEKLKKLTEPEAKVLRDGEIIKIPSKNLVVGDIIILEAGDIVPSDSRLISTISFKCDESALTGESVPCEKDAKAILVPSTPLAERKNMAFSGSVVVSGHAEAIIVATGENSEIGKIANMLSATEKNVTPLQKGINTLAKITTYLVLGICLITFVIEIISKPQAPLDAFLTAIAIAVAAIPESLPAVITIIMSIGVARLAKRKAIIKHLHAIETLGACEVICSDKTGTLTQNKMEVQTVFCGNKIFEQNSVINTNEFSQMQKIMLLCENVEKNHNGYLGDPTEIALVNFAEKTLCADKKSYEKKFKLIDEIPFDSNRKLMSSIRENNGNVEVLTKGAVDEILKICTHIEINGEIKPLLPFYKEKILSANKDLANNALRVLAFAYKTINSNNLKQKFESELIFAGLVGMLDPPRKEVKKAVEKCKKAGITPVMITGDHKNTALAIARKIGITDKLSEVLTGAEIDSLSDEEFEKIIFHKKVFARVSPENKVRIVATFKKLGKIVAMTGDGVNDAPSIKNADIGIGMGIAGTDVTKEVSDVIITDDNFATIILAVEEGRKIYSNIQKTVQFLFSANLAELTAIFLATIFLPQATFLTPVQILFVNLISDTLPAIALGVEPAEKDLMRFPPRNTKYGILGNGIGRKIFVIGILQGLIMLSCFFYGYFVLHDTIIATTMAFYALNVVQFFYFISMRTNGSIWQNPISNNKLAVLAVAVCFAFILIVAISPISTLLGLCALPFSCWLFIGLACVFTFVISEIIKRAR